MPEGTVRTLTFWEDVPLCGLVVSWEYVTVDYGRGAPERAAGIQRVKGAKSIGVRAGDWPTLRQANALPNAPDIATIKGLRELRHHRRAPRLCPCARPAVAEPTD